MNTIYKINCEDKRELLKAFVTSDKLNKQEEVITAFLNRGSFIVTKNNSRHVPESSKIAAAKGIANVAGSKARVALSVIDNREAELKIFAKKLSSRDNECINAFLEELGRKGIRVS